MKKQLFITIMAVLCVQAAFSISDKIRLGVYVAPGVAWMQAEGKDLSKGPAAFGLNYGLNVEYYFKDKNYAFVTGLAGGMEGGAVRDRDYFSVRTATGNSSVLEKYNVQNISIPIYIKLKTNEIKRFHVFGQVGFEPVITVYSRATYNQLIFREPYNTTTTNESFDISKENILSKTNDVSKVAPGFHYNYFDIRLGVIGGAEYDINDKTSVLFSVGYHNGFLNTISDTKIDSKGDPILMRNFLFTMGVMF